MRLYPMYIVIFLLIYNILPMLAQGPFFYDNLFIKNDCNRNWWRNLIFINSYSKTTDMCAVWTWYVANDMHFFLITIPIAIAFVYKQIIGILLAVGLMLSSLIVSFIIFYSRNYKVYTMDSELSAEI